MYTDDIMDLRKQYYKSDLRGRYIQFLEHIHDMVRVGDVVQLSTPLSVFGELQNIAILIVNIVTQVNL